ncbi:PRKR-interacting protein 1 homolog [Wyeomyia smithii]|uniref:PRKR-interacting protein 1 homolog n=1 Tax=Wyeomyia smithii TaxID=174621 RepID=UPI0024681995|nr:PRKR-interacting protein 1 homolog [Wyeomyia smithii]
MDIKNEVKSTDKDFEKKKFVVRNAADIQRAKLDKLMKNPEKPVIIPDSPKERDFSSAVPAFVRNVMGSSAGAGSGEFHVYRHLRRKEYARQKHIQEKSRAELLDEEFQQKLLQNRQIMEEKTAKNRAKRLKKKAKQKANRGKKPKQENVEQPESSEEDESDDEEKLGDTNEESSAADGNETAQSSTSHECSTTEIADDDKQQQVNASENNCGSKDEKSMPITVDRDTEGLLENHDGGKTVILQEEKTHADNHHLECESNEKKDE